MKRSFKVEVNGKVYVVEVEEIGGGRPKASPTPASTVPQPPANAPKPASTEPQMPSPKDAPVRSSGAGAVKAPLSGVVISVKRKAGESVKAGDVLVVLEAMKMENEVCAPVSGVVKTIAVSGRQNVAKGDLLVEIV